MMLQHARQSTAQSTTKGHLSACAVTLANDERAALGVEDKSEDWMIGRRLCCVMLQFSGLIEEWMRAVGVAGRLQPWVEVVNAGGEVVGLGWVLAAWDLHALRGWRAGPRRGVALLAELLHIPRQQELHYSSGRLMVEGLP